MNNNFAATVQPQKKNVDVFAMVAGAILALGFLLSVILLAVGFFMNLDYYIGNFNFDWGLNASCFNALIRAVSEPCLSLFEMLALLLLFVYSGLPLVMKGKKIRALFIIGFVLLFVFNTWYFIDYAWGMIREIGYMFSGSRYFLYLIRDSGLLFALRTHGFGYTLLWSLYYFFGGSAAFTGIICGIFKKKAPSTVFGIIAAISMVIAMCSYIGARSYPFFTGWNWSLTFLFCVYTAASLLYGVSVAGILIFLRPVNKKQNEN